MLRSYLLTTWRNLKKNKFFSFVNIFGLSVGLASCMLIALYLRYESGYDAYQTHIRGLYQVGTTTLKKGDVGHNDPYASPPVAAALKKEFPEVEDATRLLALMTDDKCPIQYVGPNGEKNTFLEDNGYIADPSFFRLFTYDFVEGDPRHALDNPNTIVISEEMARKLFSREQAVGKVIHVSSNFNGAYDFKVMGVFRPVDAASHIDAHFFLSYAGGDMEKYFLKNGADFVRNNMFFTYILLRPGTDPSKLEAKFPDFVRKYAGEDLKRLGGDKKQFLIPVRDIHLSDKVTANVTPPASKTYLYILASIAVFILLIACINFMNLSTARSAARSAEVGIRKVLGAGRGALIRQFLGESLLMTILSFVLALGITLLFLPPFAALSGKQIGLSLSKDKGLLLDFLLLALATGLIAGSYPSFYLSSFNAVKVLKGKLANSLAVAAVRKGLVVFQFIISIALIISSLVIARQLNYIRGADLGFAKDQQIILPLRSTYSKSTYRALKSELQQNAAVISIGASMFYPGINNAYDNVYYKDGQTMDNAVYSKLNYVDDGFMRTLELQATAGRLFTPLIKSDTAFNRIIVNETAIRRMGFTSAGAALNQNIHFDFHGTRYDFQIVGVVKDFHFQDLHVPVAPYAFQLADASSPFNYMTIHIKGSNMDQVLKRIRDTWNKYDPGELFEYSFLDATFQKNYLSDDRLAAIVGYFTIVAIVISCLGLFGLAAFSAEQRVKEIGIRKVLGASIRGIITLLSVDFLKLIVLAIVIASPVAWWSMNRWLEGFAYRRPIDWTIFADAFAIAISLGLLTIGSQAAKAAIANPVDSLRTE
jgi:putative ABC transport system permease protein